MKCDSLLALADRVNPGDRVNCLPTLLPEKMLPGWLLLTETPETRGESISNSETNDADCSQKKSTPHHIFM
jgi:hypothetical protein